MKLSLGRAAEVTLGRQRAPQYAEGDHVVPYLRSANVTDGALDLSDVKEMNFTPAEQGVFSLAAGDVLLTEGSGSRDTVGTSAVWNDEIPSPVCFQNTLLRLRPRKDVTDGRYLAWWARHARSSGQIAAVSTGANILHLGSDGLKRLGIVVPTVEEQRRIADFLDVRVARIDRTIAARCKQITALTELSARSSFNVVRGSTLAGPRRDSGLRWLGDVPEDWPMLSVATEFNVELGKMLDEKRQTGEYSIPYLRNTNVQWDHIDTEDLKAMDIAPDERNRFTVRAGDLMICEGGQPGRSAIWSGDITPLGYQKALHRARSRGRSREGWLLECLRAASGMNAFAVEAEQTTIGHLTNEQLRSQRFPFPNPQIQDDLLRNLSAGSDERARTSEGCLRSIDLLSEYKASLITAAVTGEFDVTTAGSGVPG